ncbi:hypothetical protein M8C21_024276 [Ambrosia artemisiifolia]|uniref:Uncharacterized protein n=1 Tax=Ambrosia artemisiifolia TaxID=4212 RepID=A0AAD5GEW2_AMBAR|nr:hypothetical protein M8C21_024276 [Ambrosia artemisiifolia]
MGLTYKNSITTPPTWDMLALTTLNLFYVIMYADNTDGSAGLFSNCANLKNLTLNFCSMGSGRFNICHPRLSNLTLIDSQQYGDVDVVAPQLKNITITNWRGIHLVSTPNLASLQCEGRSFPLQVSAELLHLEMVDICVLHPGDSRKDAHEIVCLLQKLHCVKFLTLNPEIIKVLCLYVELISHQSSPFANLKSLKIHPKIYPDYVTLTEQTQAEVTMSTEVKNYFLDGSPDASFKMVSHEDIRAMQKTKLAQSLITELQALLEQDKASIETKMVKMHEEKTDIDGCWKYLSVQIEKGKEKTSDIISKLKEIKDIITELPASNQATIQPSFSTLCMEADIVMNKITDCTKRQCDENLRRVNVCFHELATTLQTPS